MFLERKQGIKIDNKYKTCKWCYKSYTVTKKDEHKICESKSKKMRPMMSKKKMYDPSGPNTPEDEEDHDWDVSDTDTDSASSPSDGEREGADEVEEKDDQTGAGGGGKEKGERKGKGADGARPRSEARPSHDEQLYIQILMELVSLV